MPSSIQSQDCSIESLIQTIKKKQLKERMVPVPLAKDVDPPDQNVLIQYVEIQNALTMIRYDKQSSTVIYEARPRLCASDETIFNYLKLLYSFFHHVTVFEHNGYITSYRVKGMKDEADLLYRNFKITNGLDCYVQLFDNIKGTLFEKPFTAKLFTSDKKENVQNNLLDYFQLALYKNKFIGINICGFTAEEIQTHPLLQNIIHTFQSVFILFSQGISIGGYLFEHHQE